MLRCCQFEDCLTSLWNHISFKRDHIVWYIVWYIVWSLKVCSIFVSFCAGLDRRWYGSLSLVARRGKKLSFVKVEQCNWYANWVNDWVTMLYVNSNVFDTHSSTSTLMTLIVWPLIRTGSIWNCGFAERLKMWVQCRSIYFLYVWWYPSFRNHPEFGFATPIAQQDASAGDNQLP